MPRAVRRLTLRLPDSLHEQLAALAEAEGLSLNQFIVGSLARAVTVGDLELQWHTFEQLVSRFPAEGAEVALRRQMDSRVGGNDDSGHCGGARG